MYRIRNLVLRAIYFVLRLFPEAIYPKEPDISKVRRGELAKELQANPVYTTFIKDAKERLWRQFLSLTIKDIDGRERIYDMAKCMDLLEAELNRYVSDAIVEARSEELRKKLMKETRHG